MTQQHPEARPIRSFVKREGKITKGQQNAIDRLWPLYGVDLAQGALTMPDLFARDAFTVLEIGFGNGLSLAEMAEQYPQQNFFGIEVHRPGVGSLLVQVGQRELENVRVSMDDAVAVLREQVAPQSLDRVQIFFPDPWHKKRHHKRRLIQADFVGLICERLKPGGVLHVATDWENYAEHILAVLSAEQRLENMAEGSLPSADGSLPGAEGSLFAAGQPARAEGSLPRAEGSPFEADLSARAEGSLPGAEGSLHTAEGSLLEAGCCEKPEYRPRTKYEARGERLGHGVWDILFQLKT